MKITEEEFQVAWMVVKNNAMVDWPNCVCIIEEYIKQLKDQMEFQAEKYRLELEDIKENW